VFLYSALSAFRDGPGRVISPGAALRRVPGLRAAGLRSAAVYGDHQMNDARKAIMTVRAAADASASVLNHAPVTQLVTTRGWVTEAGVRDALTGAELGVRARKILNATGPRWITCAG
jgi:glycerol-3-phosphate dehydrogenase